MAKTFRMSPEAAAYQKRNQANLDRTCIITFEEVSGQKLSLTYLRGFDALEYLWAHPDEEFNRGGLARYVRRALGYHKEPRSGTPLGIFSQQEVCDLVNGFYIEVAKQRRAADLPEVPLEKRV